MADAAIRRKAAGIPWRQEGTIMRILALWTLVWFSIWAGPAHARAEQYPSGLDNTPGTKSHLLDNGDFERGLAGWSPFWSRQSGAGSSTVEKELVHQGKSSVRIDHRGKEDWSLAAAKSLPVHPGELYQFSGWVNLAGQGNCEISVILRDAADHVIDYTYAGRSSHETKGWRELKSRFMIPPGAATMLPRVIGYGPAVVRVDEVKLQRLRGAINPRTTGMPAKVEASSKSLAVSFDTKRGALTVVDRGTGQTWRQRPAGAALLVRAARAHEQSIEATLVNPPTALEIHATFTLQPDRPEIAIALSGSGELGQSLAFPYPFASPKGSYLVMPVNEGMSYPVDDPSLPPMHYILYGGHGLCMGWWGVTDGRGGMMAIIDTADDASVLVPRLQGKLCLCPLWDAQKGMFGPVRRMRYVFLDDGGYVAMAKRYRRHAREIGLLKTLKEKRSENPNVDRLIGAVNVWCWDRDPIGIVKELKQAGIDRILWSNQASAEQIKTLNALGVLTSRYDIYQDVMNPANFSKIRYTHPDWPTKAWPADLMIGPDGQWLRGWEIEGRDGGMYPCGVTCDRQAIPYAIERIGQELKSKPYLCRFIDTTTAAPWRECYDLHHPVTRSESRHWKMELLRLVSERYKLVTGSETGHEAAVPFVHYFEGMLSLGPYRVHDAGRNMQRIVQQVPPQIEKFQTGAFYRLPLWELVYHDCVVAQWYWGDYNNKLPAVWDRRDLYNALYGTPPMFMFTRRLWEQNRDRFVKSYQTVCPIARGTGYSEMLSHRWLSADHNVQRTVFASGQTVTVNFGKNEYVMPDGSKLGPLGLAVQNRNSPGSQE